jgi:DtxR family Mn-dependent transcriptional regulator
MSDRIHIEDALKHLHDCEYRQQSATPQSVGGTLGLPLDAAAQLLAELERSQLAVLRDGAYRLTDSGREYARHVIRAHRLYETYLAERTGMPEAQWHDAAERMEHRISSAKLERISQQLGEPGFDPHGDPIPTKSGELPPPRGFPLLECPSGWEGQVTHVEDEPPAGYQEVIQTGITCGTRLRVEKSDSQTVRISAEGRVSDLSRLAASHVMVAELPSTEHFDSSVERLSALQPGEKAAVVGLSPSCRGPERNRLLDLGVVPGTVVEIDLVSPAKNPIAYRIRGASIALRREQADRVLIRKT